MNSAASVRSAVSTTTTQRQDELRAEHINRFQVQRVHQLQSAVPLDDRVLLRLLLRSIMYDVPWKKSEEERLSEGDYSVLERLDVARRMIPCIDNNTFDAAVTEIREEDPIVSLKVLYMEAEDFKNQQIAPPDSFYEGVNWKNPEQRHKRVREFYNVAQKRVRFAFKDDSQRKEEAWKIWNIVQSGEAMRRPPPRGDLILPGENYFEDPSSSSSASPNPNNTNEPDSNNNGMNFTNSNGGDAATNMGRIPHASLVEPDGQFIGGNLTSCFGGVLAIRVHALRFQGKSDSKVVAALPQRLNGSFVFCLNTRPQSVENDLSTCAMRSFMTPHTVTDYDAELGEDLALPEYYLGEHKELFAKKRERKNNNNRPRSESLQNRGLDGAGIVGGNGNNNHHKKNKRNNNNNNNNTNDDDDKEYDVINNNDDADGDQENGEKNLPEIDDISHLPVIDTRAADYANKVNGNKNNNGRGGGNNNNVVGGKNKYTGTGQEQQSSSNNNNNDDGENKSPSSSSSSESSFYWDFRDEHVTLDLGSSPIRIDFGELVLNFRTPPTCCGIFGVNEICTARIPMSALYVHILALNSINRRRHFGPGEEGVHNIHKWFECSPLGKVASAVEEKGTFSICLSMHLQCRSRAHNKPLFPSWNPFTDPQFDIHKGCCKINTDVPAMQQIWKEPLHRYFINLIENFNSRLDDIEMNVIENFHDLYILDPQLLFIWTLRSQLFSGKLYSLEDRQTIRRAATHLSALLQSGEQLYTYTAEKLVLDTKKHTINRFLALPGSLEEVFGEDDRIVHANDALYLAILVLQNFNFTDLEPSIAEAAKKDVAAFFVVACDTIAEIATRFGQHCQEVLKDFSLCFHHMKKAITFGVKVKQIEEKVQQRAGVLAANSKNLAATRLTASKVIFLRMKVMGEEVCRRLKTAVNHIHVVGASSITKDRPEAISPLMQLMQAATDCADQLRDYDLEDIAHELEGIVPQTFLPMFLSLARERLHSLVGDIVRKFPLEPSKPGRIYSTPGASDAFQFVRATFDEFTECAKSCDIETVLICLGSLMNYLIEAVDVFITSMKEWATELDETSNPIDGALEKADTVSGACLAKFNKDKIYFERTLTLHATLNSFYRLLVDFWDDEATVDFIKNLEAAVEHMNDQEDEGNDCEHQVFQAKASMMQAVQSAIFELEVAMVDQVFPSAIALPREYVKWSRTCPVKTEEELTDQQHDIAAATAHCIRQVFLAVMHRADRDVLRDRLCHVTVRGVVTNLINDLILYGPMMTAPENHQMNQRLQRGMLTAIVQVTREELVALCEAAGEQVLATTSSMLNELDTALAIGLMSSHQLVGTLDDLEIQIEAEAAEKKKNGDGNTNNGSNKQQQQQQPPGHRRQVSAGISMLKISKEKYEKLLRRACVVRAKADDETCLDYAMKTQMKEFANPNKNDAVAAKNGKK